MRPDAEAARRRRLTLLAVGLFYGLIVAFVVLLVAAGDLMGTRVVSGLKVWHVVGICVFVTEWVVVYAYSRVRELPGAEADVSSR